MIERVAVLSNAVATDAAAAAALTRIEDDWLAAAEADAAFDQARECWQQGFTVFETELTDVLDGNDRYVGYVEPVGIGWVAHLFVENEHGWSGHHPPRGLFGSVDLAARALLAAAPTIADRWQTALERAMRNGVQVLQVSGTGAWVATSGSRHVAYQVDARHCECEAALLGGDEVCQHRAMFRYLSGQLALAEPGPAPESAPSGAAAPASETAPHRMPCERCGGSGEVRMQVGGRLSDFWAGKCGGCAGSGLVPVAVLVA